MVLVVYVLTIRGISLECYIENRKNLAKVLL